METLPTEMQTAEVEDLKAQLDGLKLELQSAKMELMARNDEVCSLKKKLKKFAFCSESFTDNDKLFFYTGIARRGLFDVILRHMNSGSTKLSDLSDSLDSFQILLLVLMKLRLSISFRSLGYQFDISEHTACTIFQKSIILMYNVLHRFVHWPSRSRESGKRVSIILDCLHIVIQKPVSLIATRIETFKNQQENSVKYQIGFAPSGAVVFISERWNGYTSNDLITENGGIHNLLEPGDIVYTCWGYPLHQVVGSTFTNIKPEFFMQLEDSEYVISAVTHLRSVNGTLQNKFKFLTEPVHFTLLESKHDGNSILDYCVTVCCALTNLCTSVVP